MAEGMLRTVETLFADAVIRLNQDDETGLSAIKDEIAFWTKVLEGDGNIIESMIATARLKQDIQLIGQLRERFPTKVYKITTVFGDGTAKLAALDLKAQNRAMLRSEFRFAADLVSIGPNLRTNTRSDEGASYRFSSYFFQRNATLNLIHASYESQLAGGSPQNNCTTTISWLYNPVGRALLCKVDLNWSAYFAKIAELKSMASKLNMVFKLGQVS